MKFDKNTNILIIGLGVIGGGYAAALTGFDTALGRLLPKLREDDLLMISADHGCDPSTPSTDHSREDTPLLILGDGVRGGVDLGTRPTFADIGATVLDWFGVASDAVAGESLLPKIRKECTND